MTPKSRSIQEKALNSKNLKKSGPKAKKTKSLRHGYVFALCGAHGVGKTTVYNILENILSDNSNIRFFPERYSNNPPFPFGSKDKQIAFRSELHYNQQMMMRNKKVKEFIENQRQTVAILDRSHICTLVYSQALDLPQKDYSLIEDTDNSADWMDEYLIYLYAEPNTIMNRIIQRGSLELERLKWNEQDLIYLKRILKQYDAVIEKQKLAVKKRLDRINTENKTPQEVADEIIMIIQRRSGITLTKLIRIPSNQAKLTDYFKQK